MDAYRVISFNAVKNKSKKIYGDITGAFTFSYLGGWGKIRTRVCQNMLRKLWESEHLLKNIWTCIY